MRRQLNRELLATPATGLLLLAVTFSAPAQAGWVRTETETTRAHCNRICEDFPQGTCGARFDPSQANANYGRCQTLILDTGTTTTPNATTTPNNTTAKTPPANQGSSTLGSKTGSGGFMKHLKVSKDPEFGRKVDEALGAKPHTSSGDAPMGQ